MWQSGAVPRAQVVSMTGATCRLCLVLAMLVLGLQVSMSCSQYVREPSAAYAENAVRARGADPTLDVFQVYQPVITHQRQRYEAVSSNRDVEQKLVGPEDTSSRCLRILVDHSFGNSYGRPFVGKYTPPDCDFNKVTINLTVTSQGRQYDRLAIMYLGDVEVWRTTTAEPTVNGIRWEYTKDMTQYLSLWKDPQTIIFDLGNIVDRSINLTGFFDTTLTASFSQVNEETNPAGNIVPISRRHGSSNSPSAFSLPADQAINNITLPRNINRAVFSISACGQATEEFWWSNVLQSNVDTFEPTAGALYGHSPFREVQILIDGQLVGVYWPYPVIFTGGVVPGLWRPIVGIDAFDLREHEVDITPWLGYLCDGSEHSFEIKVIGIIDNGTTGTLTNSVGSSWLVTGKLFLWLDEDASSITNSTSFTPHVDDPIIHISYLHSQNATGFNETLVSKVEVRRELSISSTISTQSGTRNTSWAQSLVYSNHGFLTDFGSTQRNEQLTWAIDEASTGTKYYQADYMYPLTCTQSMHFDSDGNFTINGDIYVGLYLGITGEAVFPTGLESFQEEGGEGRRYTTSKLRSFQNGTAWYFGSPGQGVSKGSGRTNQEFGFWGVPEGEEMEDLYTREVEAKDGRVVSDLEKLRGKIVTQFAAINVQGESVEADLQEGCWTRKEMMGRGFKEAKRD